MMLLLDEMNWWTVLVAGVVSMVLGIVWYSPFVFGKLWMKLAGQSEEECKKTASPAFALMFVWSLLMAFVLSQMVQYSGAITWLEGIEIAFWIWLGFVAPVMGASALFEGKPFTLYLIKVGYQLVNILAMSVIVTLWL